MAIIVNTNIASINAQRSLNKTERALDKAMERIASGLRINRAGDDAAGLAIATHMEKQVRGLGQAVRNSADGLSLIGTAEGAVGMQVEILQRIRELAVQAANGINSNVSLAAIQEEINAQVAEITRIANTSEFNGVALLNGQFTNKKLQVGANANQTISISLGDYRASKIGYIATITGDHSIATGNASYLKAVNAAGVTLAIDGSFNAGAGLTGVVIDIGTGTTYAVSASTSDGVSSHFSAGSAISKANAINSISSSTGVTAVANADVLRGTTLIAGGTVTAGGTTTFSINGVSIVDGATLATNMVVAANDATGVLRNAINAKSNQTGVVASIEGTNTLVLTAADGRNIVVDAAASVAAALGFTTGLGSSGTVATHLGTGYITLTANRDFTITSDGTVATKILGLTAAVTHTINGSLDLTKAVATINVVPSGGADTAINIVDSALGTLSDATSDMGAITNRLENTMSNLRISIENMSAAESRIRDADFAAETANMTRAQIIQQAGVAVLTQANLRPQAALALLGG
jgi:flagellin